MKHQMIYLYINIKYMKNSSFTKLCLIIEYEMKQTKFFSSIKIQEIKIGFHLFSNVMLC